MKDFLLILFGLTMVYLALTSRYKAYIQMIGVQGFILFLLVISDYETLNLGSIIFLSFETLFFKAMLIPFLLFTVLKKSPITRDSGTDIPQFYSIVIETMIFVAGFWIANWSSSLHTDVKPLFFGISISTILTALFIIVTRKRILTHVMGYMILENSIFLLSLSIASEMPFVVNLGVILDIFIAVFVFGLFVVRIQSTFDDMTIDKLSNLRD